jgi:hypothetical protein
VADGGLIVTYDLTPKPPPERRSLWVGAAWTVAVFVGLALASLGVGVMVVGASLWIEGGVLRWDWTSAGYIAGGWTVVLLGSYLGNTALDELNVDRPYWDL